MDITARKSSNEEALLCCRACLSTDVKLFNIHDYKLGDAFANITGAPVYKDRMPQHLCVYCGARLLKCASFRDMCLETQECLVSRLLTEKLDTNSIRKINGLNQSLKLSLTEVKTIEYIDNIDIPAETIKDEPNIDIVDIDGIIKQVDLKIEFEKNDKKPVRRKRKIETKNKKKKSHEKAIEVIVNEEQKVEAIKEEIDVNYKTYEESVETKKEFEVDIGDDDYEIDFDSEDSEEIPLIKKKRNIKSKKVNSEVSDKCKDNVNNVVKPKRRRKRKEEVTRKFRKPENDYMPVFDFATFESSYDVKIVVLSKEEQLEEIAERKKSRNYLDSHFRCDDCGKGFDAEPAYNNHRIRHSPAEGNFVCEICAVRFKRQCVRQHHQDMHRLKFLCNECSYISRDRGQARKHHEMHGGKTFECQHCGKTFIKSSTYLSHVRLAHPAMNVACDLCGETFIGQVGLRMHKSRMHPEHKPQKFKCSTCSANFVSLDALNRHTDTAGEHRELRPCEQCGENCASETELQEHVKGRHPKETYNCDECGMTFPHASAYDVHHRRKHLNQRYSDAGRKMARKKYPVKPARGECVCETCGKVTQTVAGLRTHQSSHMDVKPFACNECPKSFALKTSLQWHMRSHTGEKPYQCTECPLAFSLKGNLVRHQKTAHLGMRASVPCPICGRIFTTNSCVRVHINTVHHGQPGPKRDRRKRNKFGKTPEALIIDNKLS